MLIAAGLALSAVLAQNPTVSLEPDEHRAPPRQVAEDSALWLGGAVSRCPENLRLEGRNLRLIEVPDTTPQLADKTGGRPGGVPPPITGVPCIAPARR